MPATPVRAAARFVTLSLLVAAAAAAGGCRRPAPHFSIDNVRAHVAMLAGTIGVRPTGSAANRRAREYVVSQLQLYGYAVRVQEVDARRPEHGLTARVANVIGVVPGRVPDAIGLVSHYDSRSTTPGAADAALGVGVALETGRLLAVRQDRVNSVMVILTDGEEMGLMGAAGILEDREVASRLRAYLNLEAVGSGKPAVLFEAGPANGWIVSAWAHAAPEPRGASYYHEIYERLPNDTDFSVLKSLGVPGLNFAAAGDSFAYHTSRDTPERLDRDVIAQMGRNALATAVALDGATLGARTPEAPVFFDLGGAIAWTLRPALSQAIAVTALLLGLLACGRAFAAVRQHADPVGMVRTLVWIVIGALLVAGAMIAAAWLLRAVREVYHPWYAHPNRFAAMLVLTGFCALWLLTRLAVLLPVRAQAVQHPAIAWTATLALWVGLCGAAAWYAPAAAYLWSLPLLVAALLVLLLGAANARLAPLTGTLTLAAAGGLWLPELHALLQFINPTLGRLPIVAPVFAMPAVLILAGLMIVPPIALVFMGTNDSRSGQSRLLTVWRYLRTPALMAAWSVAFAICYLAEAYTPERPLWRFARFIQDGTGRCAQADAGADSGCAAYEVAGIEPGLDLALDRGAPSGWALADGRSRPALPLAPLPHPFTFVTPAGREPAPGRAHVRVVDLAADRVTLEVTVQPDEPGLDVAFVLPAGVTPRDTSLPGVVRQGRWTAIFRGAPQAGVTLTATLPSQAAGSAAPVTVRLSRSGLPGGDGPFGLPRWLGTTRTAWDARSTWFLDALPAGDNPGSLR